MTGPTRAPGRLPALDGVRALSVIGVIASHAGAFRLGWLGVDMFFGLSGYLITGILLDAKGAPAREYFLPFYMRRALRILPLAWAVLVIMCTIRGQWSGFGWYLGYVVNWLPTSPPPRDLGHYWSLAVEEQFYLVWPALVFALSRRNLGRMTVGLIGLDVICRAVFSFWSPAFATQQWLALATFTRADTLLIGALIAQRERTSAGGRGSRWALPVAILAGASLFALFRVQFDLLHPRVFFNLEWPIVSVLVAGFLLFVLTTPPKVLEWRWLAWLGQISYGVYVIHACFGGWLHAHYPPGLRIFAIQTALTVPLAALSWYAFESPILGLKSRWPMPRLSRSTKVPNRVSEG